jgi:hypothetical protein
MFYLLLLQNELFMIFLRRAFSRCYGRTAALRLIVQLCDQDEDEDDD